jgi:hypothetical protein
VSRRSLIFAAALLAVGASAGSAAGTDRLDGRLPAPDPRKEALVVPRLLLAVPRLVFRGLAIAIGGAARVNERYRIYDHVMDALTTDDGLIGVRLAFDFASDLRPIAGLSFFYDRAFGADTSFDARFLTGGPDLIVAGAHARPLKQGRLELDIDASFRRRDDQIFQGIRSVTPPERALVRARFAADSFDLPARLRVTVARVVRLGAVAQLGVRRYSAGRDDDLPSITRAYCVRSISHCLAANVDERLVPGFSNGSQFVRTGLSLDLDTRDSAAHPTSGMLLDLAATYTVGLADPSSYLGLRGGLSAVIDLHQRTHTLLLSLRTELVVPAGNEFVPFTELPTLGGPDTLRGFAPGRFRDFSALMASLEYRWAIWMWADGFLFVDYGGTFGRAFKDASFEALRPDAGAGIRIRTQSRVFVRFQVAYGFPDGWQVYLATSATP